MPTKQDSRAAKVRVFLVDDHPIVRRGLQLLLGLETDMLVCGEADNLPEALQKIVLVKPDVAVVDLALKTSSGLELIKQLRTICPQLKILVFSMRKEAIYVQRALAAGANGYLTKEDGSEKAIEGIRWLSQGKRYFSPTVAEGIMDRLTGGVTGARSPIDTLSDRELEVLELLGDGLSSRQIAEHLRLSMKTIESHREHLKSKLGLKRATELVSYAFNWFHGERHVDDRGESPTAS